MNETTLDLRARARGINARITAVECIPLYVPFKSPFKIASGPPRERMETLIVRIVTDQGIAGIGETQAWRRQGTAETLIGLIDIIANHFAPAVIGRSPFDIAAIMSDLEQRMYHTLYAQAAVSDALYDTVGKLLEVPVHHLLGGRCRDRIQVAAVLPMKGSVPLLLDAAASFFAEGYRHFVVKAGLDIAADLANVEALRKAYGSTVEIRLDANAGLDFDRALRLLSRLAPYDIETVEQPLGIADLDGMAALARLTPVPLMADESLDTEQSALEIVRKRAASSAQTKSAKNGGIHRIQRIWHLLAAAGLGINPGNHPSTSLATAAVAHTSAAWPGPLMAGVFTLGVSGTLAADIVTTPMRPENGSIAVPDGPGLGMTLDDAAIRHLRAET